MGLQLTEDQEKCWPAEDDCSHFREDAMDFMKEVQALSVKIIEVFAEGIGLVRLPFRRSSPRLQHLAVPSAPSESSRQ